MGTLNMLGLAKRTKARFLITSTSGEVFTVRIFKVVPINVAYLPSEVYGDPEVHPQTEE